MNEGHFPPEKQRGIIVHVTIIAVLTGLSGWGFWNLTRTEVGPNFVIFLLDALLAFIPIPLFAYRLYALMRADYILDRDSLAIHWGLRVEDIPLTDIEWLRPATDLSTPLQLPWLPLPGSILGLRRHPDLGVVEFMAADKDHLLLVGTSKRVYAISPTQAARFAQLFARTIEMGSLDPAEPVSVYPSFIIAQAWENAWARFTWLAGLLINIGLFIWVGISIPSLTQISLGFSPFGGTLPPSPAASLILLPTISAVLFVAGWVAGLYFYRWEKQRALALLVWSADMLSGLAFLLAVYFILATPV
ncbi:MAG: hypothetical protein Kow002_01930 [Anaerolineales bacterium]